MNFFSRSLLIGALIVVQTHPGFAQQPPPSAEKSAPAQTPPATPPETTTPPPEAATRPEADPPMRRLDQVDVPVEEPRSETQTSQRTYRRSGSSDFPMGDHTVPSGSRTHEVVSVFGSSTVEGEVMSDVVSFMGHTRIGPGAKVGGAAVAVLGRLESEGHIRDEAVSVLGGADINGYVGNEAVAVLGNMRLGPKAIVDGDVVVVGGTLTKEPGAIVRGNEVQVPFLGGFGDLDWLAAWVKKCLVLGRPLAFGEHLGWAWAIAFSFLAFYLLLALLFPRGITKCVETLEQRPGASILSSILTVLLTPIVFVLLAFTVVGALLVPFLGVGMFFAGLFGKAVMLAWIGGGVLRLFSGERRALPVLSVLVGGGIVLLIYTVPVMGFLTYKLLSWLGLGVAVLTVAQSMKRDKPPTAKAGTSRPPSGPISPAPAGAPLPVAPMAPMSTFASETPAAPFQTNPQPATSSGFTGTSGVVADIPAVPDVGPAPVPPTMGESVTPPTPAMETSTPPPPQSPPPSFGVPPTGPAGFRATSPIAPAVEWPRATLMLRLGALGLDGVLIALIMGFASEIIPRPLRLNNGFGAWLFALATYGAVMWKLKGTTIGGIVCGLKVMRVDNRELDWATAIVRALGCFLSGAVAGLGFIWIAIDDDKQSWHDKIAGTAVVRVPKGVSLL